MTVCKMPSNIPPELNLFDFEHFDITEALKCENIYLAYPKARTYENIADFYAKSLCNKKNDGLSKKALQKQRVVLKRNYKWFYDTLGLNMPIDFDEDKRYFKCIKKRKTVSVKSPDIELKVESPDELEPITSSKVIFIPSYIRKRKYACLKSDNKCDTDAIKIADEISFKICSPWNPCPSLENNSLNIDNSPISNPLGMLCQVIKPVLTPRRILQTINDYNNKTTNQICPYYHNGRDTSVNYENVPSVNCGKENVFSSHISSSSNNNSHPLNKTQLPSLPKNSLDKFALFNVPFAYNLKNYLGDWEYHTVVSIVRYILDCEERGDFVNYEESNDYHSNRSNDYHSNRYNHYHSNRFNDFHSKRYKDYQAEWYDYYSDRYNNCHSNRFIKNSETLYTKRGRDRESGRLHKVVKLKIKEIPEDIQHLVKTMGGQKMIRFEDITPSVITSLERVVYKKKDEQNSKAKTEHSMSVVNNDRDVHNDNMPSVEISAQTVNKPLIPELAKKNDSEKRSEIEDSYQISEKNETSVQEDKQELLDPIYDKRVISLLSESANQKLVSPLKNLADVKKIKNSQVTISKNPCDEKKQLTDKRDLVVKSKKGSKNKLKNRKRKNRAERKEILRLQAKNGKKLKQPSEIGNQPSEFNDQPTKKIKITNEKTSALKNSDGKHVGRKTKKVCESRKNQVLRPLTTDLLSKILKSMQTPYAPKLQDESLEDISEDTDPENEEVLNDFDKKNENATMDSLLLASNHDLHIDDETEYNRNSVKTNNSGSCLSKIDMKNEKHAKVAEMESPVIKEKNSEINIHSDLKKDNFLKMNDSAEKKISVACKSAKTCNKEKSKLPMQYSNLLKQAQKNMNLNTCSSGENKELDLALSLKNNEINDNSVLSKNMAFRNNDHLLTQSETKNDEKESLLKSKKPKDLNSGVESITSSDNDKCSKNRSIDSKSDSHVKNKKTNSMHLTKQDSKKQAKSLDDDLNHETINKKRRIDTEKQKPKVIEDQGKNSELLQAVVFSSKDLSSQNLDKNVSLSKWSNNDLNHKTNDKKKHKSVEKSRSSRTIEDQAKSSDVLNLPVVTQLNSDKNNSVEGSESNKISKDERKISEVCQATVPQSKDFSSRNSDKNVALTKLSDNDFSHEIIEKNKHINVENCKSKRIEDQRKNSDLLSSALTSSKNVSCQNSDKNNTLTKLSDNNFNHSINDEKKHHNSVERCEGKRIIEDQEKISKELCLSKDGSSPNVDNRVSFHKMFDNDFYDNVPTKKKHILGKFERDRIIDNQLNASEMDQVSSSTNVDSSIEHTTLSSPTASYKLNSEDDGNTSSDSNSSKRKRIILRLPKAVLYGKETRKTTDVALNNVTTDNSDRTHKKKNLNDEQCFGKQDLHYALENLVHKPRTNSNVPDSDSVLCDVSELNATGSGSTSKVSEKRNADPSIVQKENKCEIKNSSLHGDGSKHVSKELSLLELARRARNKVRTKAK